MNEKWSVARRLAFVVLSALLVMACRGTLPSPPPTTEPVLETIAPEVASPSPAATPLESSPPIEPTAVPPARPAAWIDAGKLPLDNYGVSVVPLADGGAIAIGSVYTGDSGHPAAFRWAPGTTTWDEIEPLNKARTQFGATLLRDGRVLVAGGLNDAEQSFSSAYVFDPGRPSAGWSKVGLLDTARTNPSIATLPDGRVLIAGGYYRTEAGYGIASPSGLAAPRGSPPWETTAARRGSFDIDVPPYGYALATAELFDPDTGEWTPTGSLSYARAGAPAATLSDGRVLIVGTGQDSLNDVAPEAWTTAEIYDPASGTFALAGSLPAIDQNRLRDLGVDIRDSGLGPGNPGQLVALQDGGALLVGRNHWAKHDADVLQSIRFDPAHASWEETGSPCAAAGYNWGEMRRTPAPCLIGGFIAGLDGGRVLSAGRGPSMEFDAEPKSAAIYDPSDDAWLEQPSMPNAYRPGTAVGLTDGTALIVGTLQGAEHPAALQFVPPR
jgi:hypothetical protein